MPNKLALDTCGCCIFDGDDKPVALDIAPDLAADIVAAFNSHDVLIEALQFYATLEGVPEHEEYDVGVYPDGAEYQIKKPWGARARNALAKVTSA
jgi:hypothetical protein